MIYIAICDDNQKEVSLLSSKAEIWLKQYNVVANITCYTQSRILQYDVEEGRHFDLVLSDIEMPYIDGMKLAAFLRRCLPDVKIIFITSHLKYALDAYELAIFRYIPKKELDNKLPQALKDAIAMIILQTDQFYTIEMPTRVEKIPYKEIVCIHREGKNSIISQMGDKEARVRKSLTQVYEELKSEDFVYVGRGDIVNLTHIMSIKNSIVELSNGIILPVSHARLEQLAAKVSTFWEKYI